jgi:hypothetical protein
MSSSEPTPSSNGRPGQIQWEKNPRGCSPIGCMYGAVAFFALLLIAMIVLFVVRGMMGPEGLTPP